MFLNKENLMKMGMGRKLCASFILGLGLISNVSAQFTTVDDELFLGDDVFITTLSGVQGTRTDTIGNNASLQALVSIQISERFNRPCYINTHKRRITDGRNFNASRAFLNMCDGRYGDLISVGSVASRADETIDYYFDSISVCNSSTSGNQHRLKGLMTGSLAVGYMGGADEGVIEPTTITYTSAQRNCNQNNGFDDPAECPAGYVGTKLIVHSEQDGNNRRSITGLQMECREVIYGQPWRQ